jgi:hypothetical protein
MSGSLGTTARKCTNYRSDFVEVPENRKERDFVKDMDVCGSTILK